MPFEDALNNDLTGWNNILATLYLNLNVGTFQEIEPEPEPEPEIEVKHIYVDGGNFS